MKKIIKKRLHIIVLYFVIVLSVGCNIIFYEDILLEDKTKILKTMDKTTEVINLNNTINELQASHLEYATKIQTNKINLATAITNAGISTSGDDTFEKMIANVSNILETKTSDATAIETQILIGQTAYVNGEKIIGTMPNNRNVTTSINVGESYTIPIGYHDGNGKVTAIGGSTHTVQIQSRTGEYGDHYMTLYVDGVAVANSGWTFGGWNSPVINIQ